MIDLRGRLYLENGFSPVIDMINDSLGAVIDTVQTMKPAFENAMNPNPAKDMKKAVEDILPPTTENTKEQREHNEELKKGTESAKGLKGMLSGVLSVYTLIKSVKAFVSVGDEVSQINSRLALMNDNLQSTYDLNQMVFESAQRSRGAYLETANAVASLGQQTGDLFETTAELISFSEVLNKQFAINATPLESQKSAMLQLTQALGSGVLRGEEFNAIFEAAPSLIRLIADEMGVPIGLMRTMAAEGEISADIVKTALLNAADETNAVFERMPKTWAQMWQMFKNESIMALTPAMQMWNRIINSRAMQGMFNLATSAVRMFGDALLIMGAGMNAVLEWGADNWHWLGGIVSAVGGGILAILGLMVGKYIAMGAAAVVAGVKAAAAFILMNWPIVLIGAGIAFVIWLLGQMGVTAGDVGGFIMGVINVIGALWWNLGALIANVTLTAVEFVINYFQRMGYYIQLGIWSIRNGWGGMVYFMKTVFVNMGNDVIRFFSGVVNTIIDMINWVIDKANSIRVNVPDFLGGGTIGFDLNRLQNVTPTLIDMPDASGFAEAPPEAPEDIRFDRVEYMNLGEAFGEGFAFGKEGVGALGGMLDGLKQELGNALDIQGEKPEKPPGTELLEGLDDGGEAGKALKDTAKATKSIDDNLKRTNSDLSTIKDIATQRAVTNVSWDKLNVSVTNTFGDIHEKADLDGWLGTLQQGLQEAAESAMTGVTVLEY